jgi:type II protein arginine methyltransferase
MLLLLIPFHVLPGESTSYINPTMSSKIYNLIRILDRSTNPRDRMHSYAAQAESSYVVYMKNVYHIADPKSLFKFVHPNLDKNIDNSRFKTLKFEVKLDCILHGFAGYFDCVLYKDIKLSIHPFTHSKGLSSWFSLFFPISVRCSLGRKESSNIKKKKSDFFRNPNN